MLMHRSHLLQHCMHLSVQQHNLHSSLQSVYRRTRNNVRYGLTQHIRVADLRRSQDLQRCLPCRCFVVGKDIPNRVVYVTEGGAGQHHSALSTQTALLHSPHWISGEPPGTLLRGLPLQCSFKARYRQLDRLCLVSGADADSPDLQAAHMGTAFASDFESSQYTALIEVS